MFLPFQLTRDITQMYKPTFKKVGCLLCEAKFNAYVSHHLNGCRLWLKCDSQAVARHASTMCILIYIWCTLRTPSILKFIHLDICYATQHIYKYTSVTHCHWTQLLGFTETSGDSHATGAYLKSNYCIELLLKKSY